MRRTVQRPWDAQLACRLVTPLKDSWVTPNHLTTVRLATGIAAAAAFVPGTYGWSNLGALLLILSNFLDHADGELARLSGKTSRIGHLYDLASDAAVRSAGDESSQWDVLGPVELRGRAGATLTYAPRPEAVAARGVEAIAFPARSTPSSEMAGKAASQQAALCGFETEDILYLLPLVTLCNGVAPFLVVASIGAPLFAIWVMVEYRRVQRRLQSTTGQPTSGLA